MITASQDQDLADPVLSSLLSVAAWHLNQSNASWYALLSAAARPQVGGTVTVSGLAQADSVVFSQDGKTLAVVSGSTVQLRDVATGLQVGRTVTVPGFTQADQAAFSQDGSTITVFGGAQAWVAFSQDDKTLAVVSGSTVQ